MFRLLDKIRTKPKEMRKQIAFVTALAITLVIGGVWTTTLPTRFADTGELVANGIGANESRPFSGLWGQIKERFGDYRQSATALTATNSASTTATTTNSDLIDISTLLSTSTPTTTKASPPAQTILLGTTSATTSN